MRSRQPSRASALADEEQEGLLSAGGASAVALGLR